MECGISRELAWESVDSSICFKLVFELNTLYDDDKIFWQGKMFSLHNKQIIYQLSPIQNTKIDLEIGTKIRFWFSSQQNIKQTITI